MGLRARLGGRAFCYAPAMGRGYSGSGGRGGGRSYGGYGTTGDYGYGAWGNYGESQFGGGTEEDPAEPRGRRRLTPEEYWARYFAPGSYEGRTRGDDTSDRFVAPAAPGGDDQPAHRMAGPSRHPLAPREIRRSDAQLYEDICEALLQRDDVDSSDVTVVVREGGVALDGSVPQRGMRYLIEDLAAGHPAARDVDNRIKVRKA
jgi:BON domain